MSLCYFVSDLHGRARRYEKLFEAISGGRPGAVFIGGDLLPHAFQGAGGKFIRDNFLKKLESLRGEMGESYPEIFVILGNDDGRWDEKDLIKAESSGLITYAHNRKKMYGRWTVYGYAYVPPTPFRLKDWERYDVSRYVDPGSVSPEEGARSVPVNGDEVRYSTIEKDLEELADEDDLERAVFLFHAPPHDTKLDRANLDGRMIDHVPLDVHVGSIAVRRFIENRGPLVTLHGHVHESTGITGAWRDRIGRTEMFTAAHDGPELALVTFDLNDPAGARRVLL